MKLSTKGMILIKRWMRPLILMRIKLHLVKKTKDLRRSKEKRLTKILDFLRKSSRRLLRKNLTNTARKSLTISTTIQILLNKRLLILIRSLPYLRTKINQFILMLDVMAVMCSQLLDQDTNVVFVKILISALNAKRIDLMIIHS